MNLADFLKSKLQSQYKNPLWIEDKFGAGDTEIGFSSIYELDYDALAKEIDTFIATFRKKL